MHSVCNFHCGGWEKLLASNIGFRGHDHPQTGACSRLAKLTLTRVVMSVHPSGRSDMRCAASAGPVTSVTTFASPMATSHLHGSTASSFSSCICGGASRCDAAHWFAWAHRGFPVNMKFLACMFVLMRLLMVRRGLKSTCFRGWIIVCHIPRLLNATTLRSSLDMIQRLTRWSCHQQMQDTTECHAMVMLTGEMQAWALLVLTNTSIIECTR